MNALAEILANLPADELVDLLASALVNRPDTLVLEAPENWSNFRLEAESGDFQIKMRRIP